MILMIIIDGADLIFGRVATQIAKKLLLGEEVHVVNSEKMVLSGNPDVIIQRYLTKRSLKNKATPEFSPRWSKVPHLLVKRMIRGMLPWKTSRGRGAYKRLRVYSGNPKELKASKIEGAKFNGISKHITVLQLCRRLGYSG